MRKEVFFIFTIIWFSGLDAIYFGIMRSDLAFLQKNFFNEIGFVYF